MQTSGFSHKNSLCSKKSKIRDPKQAPICGNVAEPAKKNNKKKKLQGDRQEQNKQTPAISVNIKTPKKNKKRRDLREFTCFNCNKKATMPVTLQSQKTSVYLGNLRTNN